MKFERAYGKKLPYAYFGTGYQTEEKTKESLLQWVMAGDSVKSVAKTLGLWRKQWAEMRGNGCVDAQLFGKALNLQRQLRKIDIQHKLSGDIDCTDITTYLK
ncbi:hypothetical protein PC116_g15557 [Phytophthora cactorum]|uniref:Uncharacterized protein n=1 Tax=Phytophthora cactorum TaxID=29920 RepID=A0A8T1C5M0_9STRA|nr:hypothetical protein PC112_g11706 [Phytophthora cactorum]KAG2822744.1 hypothetical protein PC111_g10510 [Phytophthora cactorum]KAG2855686.1 hypothetical protein PC113_g12232 [Phytophthora cactorum]KAG2902189.1 hypothetical protein PC114_g12846 [Phytophthora cactorum]KAG2916243.1 hypothetical protein PC115_g11112 [Phytophthora cactorum]